MPAPGAQVKKKARNKNTQTSVDRYYSRCACGKRIVRRGLTGAWLLGPPAKDAVPLQTREPSPVEPPNKAKLLHVPGDRPFIPKPRVRKRKK
jgi:hypothetical protein